MSLVNNKSCLKRDLHSSYNFPREFVQSSQSEAGALPTIDNRFSLSEGIFDVSEQLGTSGSHTRRKRMAGSDDEDYILTVRKGKLKSRKVEVSERKNNNKKNREVTTSPIVGVRRGVSCGTRAVRKLLDKDSEAANKSVNLNTSLKVRESDRLFLPPSKMRLKLLIATKRRKV